MISYMADWYWLYQPRVNDPMDHPPMLTILFWFIIIWGYCEDAINSHLQYASSLE
jgi:hypothetical protein